jgi:hypothetical protein
LTSGAKKQVANIGDKFNGKLEAVKKPGVSADVTFDNQTRYQPPATDFSQRFINNISIRTALQVFGIPLAFNYTQNHANYQAINSFNNSLFKANYNNSQVGNLFKADLKQYTNFKDQFFSGLDLSDYMRKKVFGSVSSLSTLNNSKTSPLQGLMNDPAQLTHLLSLNQTQLQQQLTSVLNQSLPDSVKKKLPPGAINGTTGTTGTTAGVTGGLNQLKQNQLQQQLIKVINKLLPDSNKNKAAQVEKIVTSNESGTLNEAQLSQQITALLSPQPATVTPAKGVQAQPKTQLKPDSNALVADTIANMVAVANKVKAATEKQTFDLTNMNAKRADSLALAITKMKIQLGQSGLDVNRVLLMEKYLQDGHVSVASMNQLIQTNPNNKLQPLLTHINDFKVGNYSLTVPGGVQNDDLFITGSHLNFNMGYTPFSFGYGSLNDLNSLKDANYTSSVYSSPKNITYLSSQLNKNSLGSVKLSVVGSFGNQFSGIRYASPTLPSNTVAFTLTKGMNLGSAGNLSFDVSKSSTLFNNNYLPGSEAIIDKKAGANYNASNDLFQALAFGVDHHADVTSIGLTDNVYFNYAGMGYQNPANSGYTGAKMKYGGNVKKNFYHNKLNVSVRADVRDMPLSYATNDKWRNYQFQVDNRYQVNKHLNMSFKYTNSGTNKSVDGLSSNVYQSQMLQLDANTNFKVGKYYTVSHISIGNQNLTNIYASTTGSNMLMFNYAQSLVLNKSTVSATLFYNKELGDFKLIGNMLNSDLTCQYTVLKLVTLSSGVTYLSNVGIAQQMGVRQGVQLVAGKHFDLTSYLDLRKNLITPLYPDLYSACRAELELKYFFKTN